MTVKGNRKHTMVHAYMNIVEFKFERIHGFVHLGSPVTNSNEIQEALITLLLKGYKCYCGIKIHFISQSVTRKAKIRILLNSFYDSFLCTEKKHGHEHNQMNKGIGKILRTVHDPVQEKRYM
jgi:hypothetical protein